MIIGLIFGVPAGAIGALTIQRTLRYGFKAGFITGLGSSVGDLLYACVGVFGVTFIFQFISSYQVWISIIGAFLILLMALSIWKKETASYHYEKEKENLSRFFVYSFLIAITNPATIFSFIIAFTSLGIPAKLNTGDGIQLILGILIGTTIWWGGLAGIVSQLKTRITDKIYQKLNQVLAIFLFLFAMIVVIRALKL